MPRKYRSQPVTAQRIKADGWDEWEGVNRPLSEPTVYEIDPADHWQKLGILGPMDDPSSITPGRMCSGFCSATMTRAKNDVLRGSSFDPQLVFKRPIGWHKA
jgi:hypothetical protein